MTTSRSESTDPTLTPRLICRGAAEAIAFYVDVFDATELERFTAPEGNIVHAAISIEGVVVALADEALDWHNPSPQALGGSPVVLNLMVADPDETARRFEARGGEVVFPVADQFYGYREGRVRDPFGHVWIVSKKIADMTPEEIQSAVDSFSGDSE